MLNLLIHLSVVLFATVFCLRYLYCPQDPNTQDSAAQTIEGRVRASPRITSYNSPVGKVPGGSAIPPIRNQHTPNKIWAKSDQEKADLFGAHLEKVFSPHHKDPDPEITQQLLTSHTPFHHIPFTLQEIRIAVHHLNNKKAPGPDLVTTKMLKELPQKGLYTLLYIYNGILRTHHWPEALITAEIILRLTPGKDPKEPVISPHQLITNFIKNSRTSTCQQNYYLHSAHTLNVAPQYCNLPHPTLPANIPHMQ